MPSPYDVAVTRIEGEEITRRRSDEDQAGGLPVHVDVSGDHRRSGHRSTELVLHETCSVGAESTSSTTSFGSIPLRSLSKPKVVQS